MCFQHEGPRRCGLRASPHNMRAADQRSTHRFEIDGCAPANALSLASTGAAFALSSVQIIVLVILGPLERDFGGETA
jgi:hypothetical protein